MTLTGMETIMQALGWTLLHAVWQISLLALILFLLISFLPQQKPEIRYGLAVLSLLLTVILSAGTFWEVYKRDNSHDLHLTREQSLSPYPYTVVEERQSLTEESTASAFWPKLLARGQRWVDQHIHWLAGAWLCGILLLSLRFSGNLLYLERLRQRHTTPLPQYWQSKMQEMARVLMLSRPVRLLASGIVQTPMMIGHLKPVILIPASMLSGLTEEQLEAVIAHEMAHIYRKDYWINLLQSVVEIIFFFHPALWWISSVIRDEREKCCDDLAVSLCGNSLAYAGALARVEEIKVSRPAYALAFGGKRGSLLDRIERILQPGKQAANLKARFVSVSLVMLCLLILLSTGESRAIKYGSEKARAAFMHVKSSYFEDRVHGQSGLNYILPTDAPHKVGSEKTAQPLSEDTVPSQPSAPRVYSYHYSFHSDTTFAPIIADVPESDSLRLWHDRLQDAAMRQIGIQMDSLKGLIFKSFGDSSFFFQMDPTTAPSSAMAFALGTDSSLQVAINRAINLADSAMQGHISFSHSYRSLADGFQDSTLEARMRELERKMRQKEREMEALMREREREMEMLLEEKEAELRLKEQQLMEEMRQNEREISREMQAQERRLQEQFRETEAQIRKESREIEAEKIRMDEGINKLEALLLADQLIAKGERYNLNIRRGRILVNGKALSNRLFKKYRKFMQEEDIFSFEEGDSISISRIAQ